jgi:hypothetical protein
MDGALGYTNIIQPLGDNTFINASNGIGLEVSNGFLNISNDVYFENHGSGLSSLHIVDATVSVSQGKFIDQDVPGNAIHIEGEGSNDTLIDICSFQNGEPGHHFIRADGSSPLIRNCTFQGLSPSGPLSVIANDFFGHSAHPILRNPNPPGTTFDNSTLNATGGSSVSLQWYKDVYVEDPDGNPIVNSPVRIKDRLGNPAQPPVMLTNATGWARGFIVTELIQYNTTRVILNPFNVSAENNTMYGYVHPEETINMSMVNNITVPFLPAPPQPSPSPPVGLQAKLVGSITNVMLSWNASADDGKGENDVEGYTVYKSNTGVNGTYGFVAWINATGSASYNWTDLNAGDGDWNDYFYVVRANDTLNTEEKNNNKVGKFVNYCENGWNLISLPLIQINTSRESVLRAVDGNYVSMQGYHAGKSRPWLHWHRGKPHYFNDPMDINHMQGYYIDMQIPDYLVVAGKVPSNIQISLKTGWNLVDYPYLINKTVSDALSSITGKYNAVMYYDTVKDREAKLGLNDYMKPGLGYWIHATENCVWEI